MVAAAAAPFFEEQKLPAKTFPRDSCLGLIGPNYVTWQIPGSWEAEEVSAVKLGYHMISEVQNVTA